MPERRERDSRLLGLMNVARRLVAELDPETVLERLLDEARTVTGARYAALGELDESRTEPEPLLHREVPERHGLPADPADTRTVLRVPITIRGQVWGNLYLTDKAGAQAFSQDDENAAVILADWAATAIENARIHSTSEQRRVELERAVRGLDAARRVVDAVSAEPDLGRILELIVQHGRDLIEARAIVILLRDGDDLVVAASAGQLDNARGRRIPIADSTSGEVLLSGRPSWVGDAHALKVQPGYFGVTGAANALLVPMLHRGEGLGVLLAFDRGRGQDPFTTGDESLLRTFAASAANAVAISRSVETDRLRATIAAAEAERRRWARELHDETLQALGGLRVLLAGALRRDEALATRHTVAEAIDDIETEIANLRSIITELRPMLLDDLGLGPAIEALLERRRASGLEIVTALRLPDRGGPTALTSELETTIYRLIQESLTNVVKHAQASRVSVSVEVSHRAATVAVSDDGVGFDPAQGGSGFGLAGIRERIYLANGSVEIRSATGEGTTLRASFPLSGADPRADEPFSNDGLTHGVG